MRFALLATAVASNLPVRCRRRRRTRFWLRLQGKPPRPQYRPPFHSFDSHAHGSASCRAHACTDARKPCGRCFCAQLARFAIAQCRSWLVAKITLVVSIVPQVAASLVEALPGEKRKTTHKDGKGDAKKLRISSQVCIPESGGTHPAGAHSFARVRSHCTRAQPRTHTLAC